MASYRIFIKPSAVKELEGVPSLKERKSISDKILGLGTRPRPAGSVKLSGEDKYRLRYRHYRIIYSISDESREIRVVKIAHRKDVYRG